MVFLIDGKEIGTFTLPPNATDYNFNVPVFANSALTHAQHQFQLQNGQTSNDSPSLVLFDYLVYMHDGAVTSSFTLPATASSSVSRTGVGSQSSQTASNSHTSGMSTEHIVIIVLATVGGTIVLLLLALLCCWRRRRMQYVTPGNTKSKDMLPPPNMTSANTQAATSVSSPRFFRLKRPAPGHSFQVTPFTSPQSHSHSFAESSNYTSTSGVGLTSAQHSRRHAHAHPILWLSSNSPDGVTSPSEALPSSEVLPLQNHSLHRPPPTGMAVVDDTESEAVTSSYSGAPDTRERSRLSLKLSHHIYGKSPPPYTLS